MAAITEASQRKGTHAFECPNCGATLVYAADSEALDCQYCDSTHEIPTEPDNQGVHERELAELFSEATPRGLPAEKVLECEQCGACTTVAGKDKTARCAFCASELVSESDAREQITPTCVIPFKIEKEEAAKSFRTWIRGLWLRPNDLKRMAKVAAIDGVYTPFWTFDAQAESRWRAESGYAYQESQSYNDHEGKRRTRQVTKYRWQNSQGQREAFYDDLLVCASKGLERDLVRRLEPYNTTTELVPYKPEYLAGWSAEQYALEPKQAWAMARQDLEDREYAASGDEVPGDKHRGLQVTTKLSEVSWKHVLLPVWIAAYRYNGKSYRFLVNGETGEVSGEAPFSYWKLFFLIFGALLAFCSVIATGGLSLIPIGAVMLLWGMIYLAMQYFRKDED